MRQRVGERRARHVRAQDPRGDPRHDLGRQAERLRVQRRVALGLGAERVELRREVAVHAVRLQQRDRGLDGLQHRLVGDRRRRRTCAARARRRGSAAPARRPRRRAAAARARGRASRRAARRPLVEAVLALQVGLDDLQELAGLGALDDPVVVGRGHRHHLLGADRGADGPEADRVGDRARGDDRALAVHQPRHGGDRADAARVGERDVGALEVVRGELVLAGAGDQVVEGVEELRERQPAGVADDGHHQGAPAALLLDVDGDAEVDLAGVDDVRLAVDLGEGVGHDRHLLGRRARDRVGDQVREGDLLAGLLELLAAAVERGDGDRAERGRGRDRARLVHVAREHRAGALEQLRRVVLGGRGRRAVLGGGEHVGLGDAPGGAGALDRVEVDAVGGGDAGGDGGDLGALGHRRRRRRRRRGAGRRSAPAPASRRPSGAPAPAVMRARTWPTVTVSPASARISVIVPLAGAGISASTLSVEISTIVSSTSTLSPTALAHSRIVPSETDSPICGHRDVDRLGLALRLGGGRLGRRASAGASAAGPAPLVGAISARMAPTSTVSPSAKWIFTTVPEVGAGTSASTLSVEISTRVSSSAIVSPSCLCHSRMVPSETDSPIAGMATSTVVLTAMSCSDHTAFAAAVPACVGGVRSRRIRRCPRTARGRRSRRPSRRATGAARAAARRRCTAAR